MHGDFVGKFSLQVESGVVDEVHRDHGALEDGDAHVVGDVHEIVAEKVFTSDDDAGNAFVTDGGEMLFGDFFGELFEVGGFAVAKDLDAFGSEVGEESTEGESGAINGGFFDGAVKADFFS